VTYYSQPRDPGPDGTPPPPSNSPQPPDGSPPPPYQAPQPPQVIPQPSYGAPPQYGAPQPPYQAPQTVYGAPQAPPGATQAPYGAPQFPGNPQTPYGPGQVPYGPPQVPPTPYGAPQTPYNAPQAPYGPPQTPYNAPQVPYGPPQTPYGPPQTPYNAPQAPYGPPQTSYGSPQAPGTAYGQPSYARPTRRQGIKPAGGRPRARLLIAAAVAVVLIGAGVGAYALWPSGKPSSPGAGGQPPQRLSAQRLATNAVVADNFFASAPGAASSGFQTSLSNAAAVASTVVVVGSQEPVVSGAGTQRGLFLVSQNAGRTWQLAPVASPSGNAPSVVAGSRTGWVALQSQYESPAAGTTDIGGVWTSQNGTSWTENDSEATTGPFAGSSISSLAATASGFVAVGEIGSSQAAAVWTSTDGQHWRRTEPPFGSSPSVTNTLAAYGNQVLTWVSSGPFSASFWYSPDAGLTWQRVSPPPVSGVSQTAYEGVAAGPSGLYIYGTGDNASFSAVGLIFASTDGTHWSVAANAPPPGDGIGFGSLTADSSGFASFVTTGSSSQDAGLYLSGNGTSWRYAGAISGAGGGAQEMAIAGSSVIAAGDTDNGQPRTPFLAVADPAVNTVKLASIPDLMTVARAANAVAVSGGQTVVGGSANGLDAVWYGNGSSWQRAQTPAEQGEISTVTDGPAGWLATGQGTGITSSDNLTVLSSPGGKQWHSESGQSAFRAAGSYSQFLADGAASDRAGYVIGGTAFLTNNDYTAIAWFSTGPGSWGAPVRLPVPASLQDTGVDSVASGDFGFIAIGFGTKANGQTTQQAWLSGNGRSWSAISPPLPGGSSNSGFDAIAATGNEIVIFGSTGNAGHTEAFTDVSANGGSTWQVTEVPNSAGASDATAATVTATGAAATYTIAGSGPAHVMLVSSRDLSSWQASVAEGTGLYGADQDEINGLAAQGSSLIGVGSSSSYFATHTTLWQVSFP
jgi:hypothetical protein